jgi:anti-sigma-K factor RskA
MGAEGNDPVPRGAVPEGRNAALEIELEAMPALASSHCLELVLEGGGGRRFPDDF